MQINTIIQSSDQRFKDCWKQAMKMRCDEGKGAVIRDEEHTKVGEKRLQKPVEAVNGNTA